MTIASPPLPFTRSYWVQPRRLLGGFYPGDRDPAVARAKLTALLDCSITRIISLMPATEGDHAGRPFTPYHDDFLALAAQRGLEAQWHRHSIRDLGVPTAADMVTILDRLDGSLAADAGVYVHCWGGRGRTGTVMGCWLARHGDPCPLLRLRQLTHHARPHFPHVPETEAQQAFVQNWQPRS
jgi:hypothetical protein